MHKIAIFGFGGRCVNLLIELYDLLANESIKIKTEISIVAIYDSFYYDVIKSIQDKSLSKIKYFINDNVKIYSENTNEENVYLENDFDLSFISSQNYKHYQSLLLALKYNKNIFCEKPIVNNLHNLIDIKQKFMDNNRFFQTGLTLRYTKMVEIVSKHLPKIGKLTRIYGKEFVNIGHAVHIMLGWRRYKYLSGGLGLEKVVHDYDLLLYFMEKIFGIQIDNIKITGIANKTFWTESNKNNIMEKVNSDPNLFKCYHKWENRIHQTIVNDPFDKLDELGIIPDYQKVNMYFVNNDINLDFEVNIGGFRTKTERCYEFYGSNGKIIVDVIRSIMTVDLIDDKYEVNLEGDGSSHSGGDRYVMQTLIELLNNRTTSSHSVPSFDEATRSTHIGLLCEEAIENNQPYLFKK